MLTAIICLSLACPLLAAPLSPFFSYLPHYGNPRQQGPSTQGNDGFFPPVQPNPQAGVNGPVSMEIIFPHRFPGHPAGGVPSTQGFIKYSLPKAPGRKSVEIYYPYDFMQPQMIPNIPQVPQIPNLFPFEYPSKIVPQQPPAVPPYQASPPQSLNPQQPAQQEQPAETETGQTVAVNL